MSSVSPTRSSRKRGRRPPVKLTVKIPSPEKKKKIKYEEKDALHDVDDHDVDDHDVDDHDVDDHDVDDHDVDDHDVDDHDVDDHDYANAGCDFCSKSFGDRGKLLSHIRTCHRQKSHFCVCHGREFKTRKSMQMHEDKTQDGTIGQRTNYRKYTHEAVMKAYQAVKEGKMSTRKAAKKYGIPFTTLLDRVAGRFEVNSFMASSGPPPLISREDEQKLGLHVLFMAAIGYTYLRSTVTQLATELAIFKGVLEEGKALSDNWYRKFVKRWPEMIKKARFGEAYPDNPHVVKKYFEEYVQLLKAHNLSQKPENIYCLTVYELNIYKLEQCEGKRNISGGKACDVVSIILCCNAAGTTMAPFMVFSGTSYTEKLLEGCLPNAQARVTVSGEVDSLIFKDYFRNHLLKLLKEDEANSGPVVVMYNGHLIHFEMERIEWARKHGVLLFALPPQMANLKNSLDSELKELFHNFFKQEAKKYKRKHSGDPLTKYNVCSIVTRVFPQVFTTRILNRFFKTGGIYPVGPELVDPNVTYADVESFNDSVYDDLESTDAFLEVRLPFPNVANRVLQRRNEVPLQPHPCLNLTQQSFIQSQSSQQDSPKKSPKKMAQGEKNRSPTCPRIDWNSKNFEISVCEHSYVQGVDEIDEGSGVVAVKPVISLPRAGVNYGIPCPHNSSSSLELTQTVDDVVGEVVCAGMLESVPVVETQVVSSVVEVGTTEEAVVEVGTTEEAPVILELAAASAVVASPEPVEEVTLKKIGEYTGLDEMTGQRYSYATDPVTKIRYKIMFAD